MEKSANNSSSYRWLFIVVFFIANFNALLQIYIPRMALTGLYLALLVYALMKELRISRFRIPVSRGRAFVLLYVLWIALRFAFQLIGGEITSLSLISFAQTFVPVFAFFIAESLTDEDALQCERFFVLTALISVLLGFINQAVNVIPSSYFANELVRVQGRIYNRFYSMSGYSLGTGWMSGVAIAFLTYSGNRVIKSKLTRVVAYFIFTISILLTFSRGSVFFTAIILLVIGAWKLFDPRERLRTWQLIGIIAAVGIGVVLVTVYWNAITSSSFYARYVLNAFDSSTSLRAGFQSRAMDLIKSHLAIGKGFGFVGTTAYSSGIGEGFPPENNYYLILINTGLIGFMLFILSTGYMICKKSVRGGYRTNSRVIVYYGIVTGALAWSLMSTPLEGDINTMLFWYSIGRILSATDSKVLGSEYAEIGEPNVKRA